MISRSLFEVSSRFDDQYLSETYQDADLCLKVQKQNLHVLVSNNLLVVPRFSAREHDEVEDRTLFVSQWEGKLRKMVKEKSLHLNVMWDLYCGCTGLNIEAINFLVPLEERVKLAAIAGPGEEYSWNILVQGSFLLFQGLAQRKSLKKKKRTLRIRSRA